MSSDPIRGKTMRWTYDDGAMAGKTYEHSFGSDGTVRWTEIGQPDDGKRATAPGDDNTATYEVERVNDDAYVLSYLSKSGYTLTTAVDTKTGAIVSFASNEKQLSKHRGKLVGAKT